MVVKFELYEATIGMWRKISIVPIRRVHIAISLFRQEIMHARLLISIVAQSFIASFAFDLSDSAQVAGSSPRDAC